MQRDEHAVQVGLGGITVELGKIKRDVEAIPGARERFAALKLPMSSALLRYRSYRESTLAPCDAIGSVVLRCLERVGVAAADIDLFVLTSADASFLADRKLVPSLLARHGLVRAVPMAIVSQECTGLLSAIHIASRYIRSGLSRRILVASYDRGGVDADRIQSFGVVSDAASACLVSSQEPLDFKVLGFAQYGDVQGMQGEDDFDQRQALINRVNAAALAEAGVSLDDIGRVFSTNFFWPLASFYAAAAGIPSNLLHDATLFDVGHCLSADALLNLDDYHRRAEGRPGQRYLLQAFAMGLLASMVVERSSSPLRT